MIRSLFDFVHSLLSPVATGALVVGLAPQTKLQGSKLKHETLQINRISVYF